MKKNILIAAFAVLVSSSNLFAVAHNLKDHGMVAGLTRVYTTAENPDNLAPIIREYYERVQQGQYDIPFEDFQKLYEELSKITSQGSRFQP